MSPAKNSLVLAMRGALGLAALLVAAGCMTPGRTDGARVGPLFTPTNFVGEPSLGGIRRVVVLPVWGGSAASAETAAELDPIVQLALQKSQRFEVVALSRDESLRRFRAESFSSASALPHGMFAALRQEFAADAVMFVDVTAHRAYRPLALGFRAKLAAIDGTRLVWTFDNLFATDDVTVANAARNFYLDADQRVPVDLTHGALQSPSRFAAYVSAAMCATLPPVTAPVLTQTSKSKKPAR